MIPALANHLWQSTIFACIVALVTLALRRNQARTRHALWLAASVKFLVPFSLLIALGSQVQWRSAPTAPPPALSFTMEDLSQPFANPPAVQFAPAAPVPIRWIPPTLIGLWLCGAAAILARWMLRWRRVTTTLRAAQPAASGREWEALRRVEHAAGIRQPIPLVSSDAALEPGVFGILRPVLWLPGGIAARLSDTQLDAIIAHEICHIRRRDNLAAAVHMVVEALFWFHPLVWWLGARLVDERERACDEEVLLLGSDPQTYAESILRVCQFCLESPLACVSGITGADLKRRVEAIMTHRFARNLAFGKKLLLATLAIAAIAGPLAIGLLNAPRGHAQAAAGGPAPTFDVASVKALKQPWIETAPTRSPGRFTWTTDLMYLIGYAYRMQPFRVSGPIPGSAEMAYRVDATFSPSATDDQIRLMLQSLLADRFQMVSHRVTKDAEGYQLSVAKSGLKIHEAKAEDPPAPLPESFRTGKGAVTPAEIEGKVIALGSGPGITEITARRVSMQQFCEAIQRQLGTAVWDETGLKGDYYFSFRYARENAPVDVDALPIAAALRELGLKLEKHKGPVEMLVVDHIGKLPSENLPSAEPEPEPGAAASGPHEPQQPAAPAAPRLTFEVASIKPVPSPVTMAEFTKRAHRAVDDAIFDEGMGSLIDLILYAYNLDQDKLSAPAWMEEARFDISAKLPAGATKAQVPEMLRNLLADRFKLVIHHEQRPTNVYALTLDKGPLKLQPSPDDDSEPNPCNGGYNGIHTCHKVDMESLVRVLNQVSRMTRRMGIEMMPWSIDRPVVDETGLKGLYDFTLIYGRSGGPGRGAQRGAEPSGEMQDLPLTDGLRQLGLKLEPRKLPWDYLVVDHAERTPIEN